MVYLEQDFIYRFIPHIEKSSATAIGSVGSEIATFEWALLISI